MKTIEDGERWLRNFWSCLDVRFLRNKNTGFFAVSLLQAVRQFAMQGAIHRASALAGSPPSSWLGDAGKVGPVPVCRTWRELHFNLDGWCGRLQRVLLVELGFGAWEISLELERWYGMSAME